MNDITCHKIPGALHFKEITSKNDIVRDESVDGYLIRSSESEARRIIDSLKGSNKKIAFVGGDNIRNRRAIETLKIDFLVSPEGGLRKDTLKQRDSGFNHVLAKEAVRRGISIVVDMGLVLSSSSLNRAELLSRLMQNIAVCRKARCSIKIASFAHSKKNVLSAKARASFGMSLGMSSQQAKNSVSF